MSEAFCTAMFLSVSGGLQDVYTYLYRGKVFANAQTGNIVLCSVKLVEGDWSAVLRICTSTHTPSGPITVECNAS